MQTSDNAKRVVKATPGKRTKNQNGAAPTEDSDRSVNAALGGRLKVEKARQRLAQERERVADGTLSKATYDKHAKAYRKQAADVRQQTWQLSMEKRRLIHQVVTGQRGLASAKAHLDDLRERVAAGKADEAAYWRHRAAIEKRREQVQAQTRQLPDATGYDAAELADGKGAVCGSSGVFRECATGGAGPTDDDRTICLSSITGCWSWAGSGKGDGSASASSRTDGCRTAATMVRNTASARCGLSPCGGHTAYRAAAPETSLVTASLTTDFPGSAQIGDWVVGTATVRRVGRRLAFTTCEFTPNHQLVLAASGVFATVTAPKNGRR